MPAPGLRPPLSSDLLTVSVVIPCYEQGHFLADAIESALAQDHPTHEIIVVNDGSKDNTEAVAAGFPTVRHIRQTNSGVSAARNRGMRESTGELLTFLDADDRLLPNALETAARFLGGRPDLAFTWGFNRPISSEGETIGPISNPITGPSTFERLLERNIVGPPVGVVFRRAPLEEHGGFAADLRWVEDYDMYMRLAKGHPFESHGKVVAEYRYHESKVSDDMERMYDSTIQMYDRNEALYRDDPRLRSAQRRGRRNAAARYLAEPRWERLGALAREGRWLAVATEACGLAIRYPGTFFPRVGRRLRRAFGGGVG